nr:bifunctional UDP-sugar hydrolase/5'-nucleotidase [Bacillus sp. REN3]
MGEVIHIYHTNDLHSHLEHWPGIRALLAERKRWHEEAGDGVLIFDIGDHMDRWHPLSDATRGKANCELLNEAGYDAATIGNNEGITLPFEDLDTMYLRRNFDMLVANLYLPDGSRPAWAKPYHVYITNTGTRIGVIGVTANFTRFYEQLGWKLTDPFVELERCLSELDGRTDAVILLSHLGIHDDELIAGRFPEIDVILGGHTHHILHEGKEVGNTLLAGAGKHGRYTGHVTLEIDEGTKRIVTKKAFLYDMHEREQTEGQQAIAKGYYRTGKQLMEKRVAELPEDLAADPMERSRLSKLLTEALREWCDADCAFMNAGMLIGGLRRGTVTQFDLLEICPHPINPCTVSLTGSELKEVLLQTKDEKWPHLQIKGLGFRGTVMGVMDYAGIEVVKRNEIFINGKPIEAKKKYLLAIPDMFTFGRFFPQIYRAEDKKYWLPEFLRNLLEWKISTIYK